MDGFDTYKAETRALPLLDVASLHHQRPVEIGIEVPPDESADAFTDPRSYDTVCIGVGDVGVSTKETDEYTDNTVERAEPLVVAEPALGAAALGTTHHELVVDETAEATEITAAPEKRPQDVVKIRVIPTAHSQANAANIAAALDGCQTAVFETAGGTPEQRATMEELANTLHSNPDRVEQVTAMTLLDGWGLEWLTDTIWRLPDSVKAIKFADIDCNSPVYDAAVATRQQRSAWSDATHTATTPNDGPGGSRELGEAYLRESARVSIEREPVMAAEVSNIAADIATQPDVTADKPHIMGFVTGVGHGGPPRQLQADGFDVTLTPALPQSYITGEPVTAVYAGIVYDLVAGGDPDAPIDPARIDRATVELTYQTAGATERAASAIAQAMTDVEVQAVLDGVDFLRAFAGNSPKAVWPIGIRRLLERAEDTVLERVRRERGH